MDENKLQQLRLELKKTITSEINFASNRYEKMANIKIKEGNLKTKTLLNKLKEENKKSEVLLESLTTQRKLLTTEINQAKAELKLIIHDAKHELLSSESTEIVEKVLEKVLNKIMD